MRNGLSPVPETPLLPDAWRMSPVQAEGGFEARRLVGGDHAFGGLAVQGTREQCVNAAWIIEIHGPDNVLHGLKVLPLLRHAPRPVDPSAPVPLRRGDDEQA
jgi:hypothetical protein